MSIVINQEKETNTKFMSNLQEGEKSHEGDWDNHARMGVQINENEHMVNATRVKIR